MQERFQGEFFKIVAWFIFLTLQKASRQLIGYNYAYNEDIIQLETYIGFWAANVNCARRN